LPGCRGVDHDNPGIQINHRGKAKRLNEKERELFRRRQSIEATIGHLKQDHRMDRCGLRGEMGDRIHALLSAVGWCRSRAIGTSGSRIQIVAA